MTEQTWTRDRVVEAVQECLDTNFSTAAQARLRLIMLQLRREEEFLAETGQEPRVIHRIDPWLEQ